MILGATVGDGKLTQPFEPESCITSPSRTVAPRMITSVISFCSNDFRFLRHCIEGASLFSQDILITVCDHFFDGSLENYALLEEAYSRFPKCTFLEFEFDPKSTYRPFSPLFPEHLNWRHEWHNTGRWLSYLFSKEAKYLLFLDADEIADAPRFKEWLEKTDLAQHLAYRFASYCHFREAKFEAKVHADFSLLVKKEALSSDLLWNEHERLGLFHTLCGNKQEGVKAEDGLPLFRHFSGVRTPEEFKKKLTTWGHHWERDWQHLLQEAYSRPFEGKDFIRGYDYHTIDPPIDPLLDPIPQIPFVLSLKEHKQRLHRFQNVILISKEDAFALDLNKKFLT